MNELADLSILKKYQKEKPKRKGLALKIPEGQYYRPQMNVYRSTFLLVFLIIDCGNKINQLFQEGVSSLSLESGDEMEHSTSSKDTI